MKLPTIVSWACFVVALFDVGPATSQTARPSQAAPVSAAHQQAMEECKALYRGALPEARCGSADNSIVVTTVRSDVVLRAGPGADFSAIGHIRGGTELEMTDCMGGWCRVDSNGLAGFVGAADLGNDAAFRSSSARRAENRTLTSPKHLRTNKIVSRGGSQTKLPPAMNGIAVAERRDQLPGNGEKNEKPTPNLTDTERRALFDDFLKWYRDGSVFGGRER
jgi:Bacterial SH3 domain